MARSYTLGGNIWASDSKGVLTPPYEKQSAQSGLTYLTSLSLQTLAAKGFAYSTYMTSPALNTYFKALSEAISVIELGTYFGSSFSKGQIVFDWPSSGYDSFTIYIFSKNFTSPLGSAVQSGAAKLLQPLITREVNQNFNWTTDIQAALEGKRAAKIIENYYITTAQCCTPSTITQFFRRIGTTLHLQKGSGMISNEIFLSNVQYNVGAVYGTAVLQSDVITPAQAYSIYYPKLQSLSAVPSLPSCSNKTAIDVKNNSVVLINSTAADNESASVYLPTTEQSYSLSIFYSAPQSYKSVMLNFLLCGSQYDGKTKNLSVLVGFESFSPNILDSLINIKWTPAPSEKFTSVTSLHGYSEASAATSFVLPQSGNQGIVSGNLLISYSTGVVLNAPRFAYFSKKSDDFYTFSTSQNYVRYNSATGYTETRAQSATNCPWGMASVGNQTDSFMVGGIQNSGSSVTPDTFFRNLKVTNTLSDYNQSVLCVKKDLKLTLQQGLAPAEGKKIVSGNITKFNYLAESFSSISIGQECVVIQQTFSSQTDGFWYEGANILFEVLASRYWSAYSSGLTWKLSMSREGYSLNYSFEGWWPSLLPLPQSFYKYSAGADKSTIYARICKFNFSSQTKSILLSTSQLQSLLGYTIAPANGLVTDDRYITINSGRCGACQNSLFGIFYATASEKSTGYLSDKKVKLTFNTGTFSTLATGFNSLSRVNVCGVSDYANNNAYFFVAGQTMIEKYNMNTSVSSILSGSGYSKAMPITSTSFETYGLILLRWPYLAFEMPDDNNFLSLQRINNVYVVNDEVVCRPSVGDGKAVHEAFSWQNGCFGASNPIMIDTSVNNFGGILQPSKPSANYEPLMYGSLDFGFAPNTSVTLYNLQNSFLNISFDVYAKFYYSVEIANNEAIYAFNGVGRSQTGAGSVAVPNTFTPYSGVK